MIEGAIVCAMGWYTEIVAPGVNPKRPGLFEWRIDGIGVYIGQYKHDSRPRREYGRNVAKLLAKRPYRKSKPDGFRVLHRKLAEAHTQKKVTLTLLENVEDKIARNRREREVIAERRFEATSWRGLPVLNLN